MHQDNNPVFFDNVTKRVVDDLKTTIRRGSKLDIAAASFSMYAYQLLKKELEQVDEVNFLFTGEVFTNENAPRESREFYIPRLRAERSLYGTDFEIKLRNELNQQAIAKECAEWIRAKVKFRSNVSGEHMTPFMAIRNEQDEAAYVPFNNFTTADLGADRGNSAYSVTTKIFAPASKQFIETFDSVWNEDGKLADVTDAVLENITAAYKENSPELIYFTALYNIFSEFLEDLNADFLPNEATGFKNSQVWGKLYDFQKDAVIGCISKLEKYNGCILADSVGLGKTFSALGVIKYYESRNKNVLVLVPKRLKDNWNTFKGNYKNNPLVEDRLRYDVLFHTDVNREYGDSNGTDLQNLNWGNYDLVVIDESHNFRNGESTTHKSGEGYENRYQKLMNKIIKQGVKTKVLMLSATPVNTKFTDLRNQLMLAAEEIFVDATITGEYGQNVVDAKKHIFDKLRYDSAVEKDFGAELDTADMVELYVKLPGGFYINTPMGKYNPDWAILFKEGSVKHIYFVAETKGDTSDLQLREVEKVKIECARRHFSAISSDTVKYDAVKSYSQLLSILNK